MMARIALAQPASASICERINSEFAFIKDRKRNRLGHDMSNWRLEQELLNLGETIRRLTLKPRHHHGEPLPRNGLL
jgi:hypothetical protein